MDNKLFVLLCVIYIIILLIVFAVFKSIGCRNYWKRAILELQTCPFGQEQLQIMSEESINEIPNPKGIVSYSLYGDYNKYSINLLKSLDTIPELSPGWQPYVYVGIDVPTTIKSKLLEKHARVITMGPEKYQGHEAALWRFLPAMQEIPFVSLDADDVFDRWIAGEIQCWIKSGKRFGNFKQYGLFAKMAAGLWGSRDSAVPDMDKLIKNYCEHIFGFDEMFLRAEISPIMCDLGYYQTTTWKLRELAILGLLLLIIAMIASLYIAKNSDYK